MMICTRHSKWHKQYNIDIDMLINYIIQLQAPLSLTAPKHTSSYGMIFITFIHFRHPGPRGVGLEQQARGSDNYVPAKSQQLYTPVQIRYDLDQKNTPIFYSKFYLKTSIDVHHHHTHREQAYWILMRWTNTAIRHADSDSFHAIFTPFFWIFSPRRSSLMSFAACKPSSPCRKRPRRVAQRPGQNKRASFDSAGRDRWRCGSGHRDVRERSLRSGAQRIPRALPDRGNQGSNRTHAAIPQAA